MTPQTPTDRRRTTVNRILIALSTRRCRGCDDASFHTAHLTTLGRRRFLGRWSR